MSHAKRYRGKQKSKCKRKGKNLFLAPVLAYLFLCQGRFYGEIRALVLSLVSALVFASLVKTWLLIWYCYTFKINYFLICISPKYFKCYKFITEFCDQPLQYGIRQRLINARDLNIHNS